MSEKCEKCGWLKDDCPCEFTESRELPKDECCDKCKHFYRLESQSLCKGYCYLTFAEMWKDYGCNLFESA